MEIRGQRECKECGTRWSYYETGTVSCPECDSVKSVGIDEERKRHTASPATLNLTSVRNMIDDESREDIAAAAVEECRDYIRSHGFIDAGELQPLDDVYLAAHELRGVADVFGRSLDPTEDEELYYLSLLRGADHGERPDTESVPASIREARGLAYANAVDEYRAELKTYLDDQPRTDHEALATLQSLTEHVKRVRALQGDVDPKTVERLVKAARALGEYLRWDDEDALVRCQERLDRLSA